jgi:4-hydroxybenzoate polyprenyltransferase
MRRMIDPRGFLLTTAVSLGLSLGAFVILHFAVGSAIALPLRFIELIFLPIYIVSGVLYVAITVKRRPDLSISLLSLGGALTSILPACVFAVVVSPSGMRVIEGREVRDPSVLVMVIVFAVVGVFFGCIGAVIYAMWDEARSLRRHRQSDTPRALPRSRKRKI